MYECTYTALEACIDGTIHTIVANTNKTNFVLQYVNLGIILVGDVVKFL